MKRISCSSIVLFLVFFATAQNSIAQHAGVKVTVTPRFVNAGQVQITKYVEKTVIIKNDSTSPAPVHVEISGPSSTQYALIGGPRTVLIAPGQRDTLVVRYTPTTVGQLFDSLIMIHDGDTSLLKNPIKEYIFGSGLAAPDTFPKPAVSVSSINFRNVPIGIKVERSFILKNISDSVHTLVGMIAAPGLPFAIDSGGAPYSLDSGKSQIVYVSFTPSTVGSFSDSILVQSNADSALRLIKVRLFGTGFIADTNHVSIKLLTRELNFGAIDTGKIDSLTFILTNVSDSNIKLAAQFQTPRAPFTLRGVSLFTRDSIAQNDSMVFTVIFRPTMPIAYTDSVVVLTNAYDTANQRVVIHLNGVGKRVATGAVAAGFLHNDPPTRVFPNPSKGLVQIDLGKDESIRQIVVVDVRGNVIFLKFLDQTERALRSASLDLTSAPAGVYFIELLGTAAMQVARLNVLR